MHIIVAWEIRTGTPESKELQSKAMMGIFEGYSWYKPMGETNFFVIRINSAEDTKFLTDQLVGVCKTVPGVYFVITSALPDSLYSGWLPQETWTELNRRTSEPEAPA